MKAHRAAIAAATLFAGSSACHAQSYIDSCAKALTYTDVSSLDDLAVQYAYLSSTQASENSKQSGSLNIVIPTPAGPIPLGASEASQRRSQLAQQLGVNWTTQQSHAFLSRYVSQSSNSAFTTCVAEFARNKKLWISVKNITDDKVVVTVHVPSQSGQNRYYVFDLRADGKFQTPVPRKLGSSGMDDFDVKSAGGIPQRT
jgi:hypothetical protein